MSKLELNAIQTKLKTAIQRHQMLVVKMKGDNQNASLKKGLAELQDEIRRLSEEQKKLVVKFRESLVKSSSQTQPQPPLTAPPVATVASVGQTITAIGQPRLVSFPTQGGAAILPVGMVAVPIAHMQRPAVGVAIHPGGTGQMSQATSISLIPTGIISSGCNISLSPINSGGAIGIGSNVGGIIQGNIAISNFPGNDVGSSASITTTPTAGVIVTDSTLLNNGTSNSGSNGAACVNGVSMAVTGCTPANSVALTSLANVNNLVMGSAINNNNNNNNHTSSTNLITTSCISSVLSASSSATVSVNSQLPSTATSNSGAGIVISQFPQQPLVQPQLLQQQQQQILKMIQQQQQQQQLPQQRLASHTPIKVPQYTASVIRPTVNSTSVQFCNIAPAPSTVALAPASKASPASTQVPAVAKTSPSKEGIPVIKETKDYTQMPKQDVPPKSQQKPQQQQHPAKQQSQQQQHHKQQLPLQEQPQPSANTTIKQLNQEEQEKVKFMQALDLYTDSALQEMMSKRTERKRRSTANPNYSFGFDMSRRDRNGSIWTTIAPKKPRIARGKGSTATGANGWSDSTSIQFPHQKSSNKLHKSNDNHDDYCAVCGKGGQLLMCETCRLVYHLDCLSPPLTEAPKYAWSCPKCLVSGKGLAHLSNEALAKVHSYIAKKAAKEDERKKIQRKGREINTEKSFLDNRSKEIDTKMKEQTELQSKLSEEEKKVKEELDRLSDFVNAMRESRTAEHLSTTKTSTSIA